MGDLDGKVALVTGASRGIGAAIAQRFAAEGATVAVSARTVAEGDSRFAGSLAATVAAIEAAVGDSKATMLSPQDSKATMLAPGGGRPAGRAVAFPADLAVPSQRAALVEQVTERLGTIDILVNNAAVTWFAPIEDFTDRRFALMFEVQVTAAVDLARRVVPGMRGRGGGAILNISSRAAVHPAPDRPARGGTVYGMCKAALERFSTGLANELYADRILVNALSPSRVVPTAGTVFHHLTTFDDPDAEPTDVMAEAALRLCRPTPTGAEPLTGRVTYSQELV